jgi:hypothetical protein
MYVDGRGFEGVDDVVGFVGQFPELRHAKIWVSSHLTQRLTNINL